MKKRVIKSVSVMGGSGGEWWAIGHDMNKNQVEGLEEWKERCKGYNRDIGPTWEEGLAAHKKRIRAFKKVEIVEIKYTCRGGYRRYAICGRDEVFGVLEVGRSETSPIFVRYKTVLHRARRKK